MPPALTQPVEIAPGLLRLTAPNPSPMTDEGTNSYLLGRDELVIIDPGPDDPRHLAALVAAVGGRKVRSIVVTHSHADHSGLAPALARALAAPIAAFGPTGAGQNPEMATLGLAPAGEGADHDFAPDILLADGEEVTTEGQPLTVLHTPGHFGNHICLGYGEMLFTGDHVMGWSSSIVIPPEGDMGDYMASLFRLQQGSWGMALPGHGPVIADTRARIAALIAHRRAREASILAALSIGPADCATLTTRTYGDLSPALWPYAEQNCLAHLIDLTRQGRVRPLGRISRGATFAPC